MSLSRQLAAKIKSNEQVYTLNCNRILDQESLAAFSEFLDRNKNITILNLYGYKHISNVFLPTLVKNTTIKQIIYGNNGKNADFISLNSWWGKDNGKKLISAKEFLKANPPKQLLSNFDYNNQAQQAGLAMRSSNKRTKTLPASVDTYKLINIKRNNTSWKKLFDKFVYNPQITALNIEGNEFLTPLFFKHLKLNTTIKTVVYGDKDDVNLLRKLCVNKTLIHSSELRKDHSNVVYPLVTSGSKVSDPSCSYVSPISSPNNEEKYASTPSPKFVDNVLVKSQSLPADRLKSNLSVLTKSQSSPAILPTGNLLTAKPSGKLFTSVLPKSESSPAIIHISKPLVGLFVEEMRKSLLSLSNLRKNWFGSFFSASVNCSAKKIMLANLADYSKNQDETKLIKDLNQYHTTLALNDPTGKKSRHLLAYKELCSGYFGPDSNDKGLSQEKLNAILSTMITPKINC